MLGSGCYLNSSVLYSTSGVGGGGGSDPLCAVCQSVLTHLRQGPLLFFHAALCPTASSPQNKKDLFNGWLVVSALRGLFIACRAISSRSSSHVTSFVSALRGALSGQAPFGNSYRWLASTSALSSTFYVQLCFDAPWSVQAPGLCCLLGRTDVPPLVKYIYCDAMIFWTPGYYWKELWGWFESTSNGEVPLKEQTWKKDMLVLLTNKSTESIQPRCKLTTAL